MYLKLLTSLLALASSLILRGEEDILVSVHVRFVDYDVQRCTGAREFTVILKCDEGAVAQQETGDGIIFLKVFPHWEYAAIRVRLATQTRNQDGSFSEREAETVPSMIGEPHKVVLSGNQYEVSLARFIR